ncbi:MAG: flavin reductase family protein [Hyphomicrobiaceae bacterium]
MTSKREIEEHALRDVLGCFATGVVVATTRGEGDAPVGLTVSSFNSVSLNPPLVLWSLACSANSHAAFSASAAFAINILSRDQADVCLQFARPAADKFRGVPWCPGIDGVPVLRDALATLECRIYRQYEGGDHTIFIGEVVQLRASEKAPLIYHRGKFTGLASMIAPTGAGCDA